MLFYCASTQNFLKGVSCNLIQGGFLNNILYEGHFILLKRTLVRNDSKWEVIGILSHWSIFTEYFHVVNRNSFNVDPTTHTQQISEGLCVSHKSNLK